MSDALQTSTVEMELDVSVKPSVTVGKRSVYMDKLTNKITLYSGVMPFTMTIEAMVEEVQDINMNTRWYATLHLTGFGTTQNVFASNTVEIVPNVPTPVVFPPASQAVGASSYGLAAIGSVPTVSSVTAMLKLTLSPTTGDLELQILNTTIDAQWVIGAIDILITDPPIIMDIVS